MAIRLSGLASGMDTESLIQGLLDAQRLKNKRVVDKQTTLTWKQEKWKELNAKLLKLYTDDLNKMQLQGSYQTKKATSSNENLASVTVNSSAPEGSHTLTINSLAKSQFVTGSEINKDKDNNLITASSSTKLTDLGITAGTNITLGKTGSTETFTVDENTTLQSLVDTAKKAGLNANFDSSQGRLFISSKDSGASNSFQITATDADGADANALLSMIGLDALNSDGTKVTPSSTLSTVIAATDSNVTYNGANLTGSTNSLSVNGLKITLKGSEAGQTVNINVTKSAQETYDMVKKFVKSYNEVLKEMNSLYYANSARDYDPLSDEEKESMTDDQITKWEGKIKDSILRRDTNLSSLSDVMRTTMMSTVDVDGKKYALSSFGIQTSSDYTERGLLHIFGDSEDSAYSADDDKLMKALEEDPDTVVDVLSSISKKLYDGMYDKMKSIPNVRSALTFYNDKTMIEQQRGYTKQIATLESKLTDLENKYYKQFAAMESAMSKMQSQGNYLAGMLGQNTSN
ncbi:MAG TPA: flagellar filament capping protein FliD [Mobilitalea sp.]|nr:flagellar filament capping protein FliD [Mobilitalea sp.]